MKISSDDILQQLQKFSNKAVLNRTILDVALDGTWMFLNEDGCFKTVYDNRFLEIFGWNNDLDGYLAQGGWEGNINQEDKYAAWQLQQEHEQSHGKVPYILYVRYTHKDGHELKVLCRGKIIEWNTDGTYKIFVGSHTLLPDEILKKDLF